MLDVGNGYGNELLEDAVIHVRQFANVQTCLAHLVFSHHCLLQERYSRDTTPSLTATEQIARERISTSRYAKCESASRTVLTPTTVRISARIAVVHHAPPCIRRMEPTM